MPWNWIRLHGLPASSPISADEAYHVRKASNAAPSVGDSFREATNDRSGDECTDQQQLRGPQRTRAKQTLRRVGLRLEQNRLDEHRGHDEKHGHLGPALTLEVNEPPDDEDCGNHREDEQLSREASTRSRRAAHGEPAPRRTAALTRRS